MNTDVAIVGGGPGGATAAMFLLKEGIKPLIVEKDAFPRYHIGESTTGEIGGVLRELDLFERVRDAGYPAKRGGKVYGTDGKYSWFVPVMARDEQGSLREGIAWQVRRSTFDKLLLDEAVSRGATLIRGRALRPLVEDGAVRGVRVELEGGGEVDVQSQVLLDCSGQHTFLANHGVAGPKYRGNYDRQIAIFSQVMGAVRDDEPHQNDTLSFYQRKYHWAWLIPLDEEVVSVGVVVPAAYFKSKKETKEAFLRRELHDLNPELRRRLPNVKLVEEIRSAVNYSYQIGTFGGDGWLCIGDAHRFIDPIFSFGLYASMKEAQFAAGAVKAFLAGEHRDFAQHQRYVEAGLDTLEDMIDTFWEHPLAFAMFVHHRYPGEMIDIFAGRVFGREPSGALQGMRRLLDRERQLDNSEMRPIGSRYHKERADIWNIHTTAIM